MTIMDNKKINDPVAVLHSYSGPLREYRLKRRCSFFDLASELSLPLKALTDIEQRNVLNEEPKILKQWVQQLESVLGPSVPLAPPVPAFLRGGAK
jgi:hypothetical protein